MDLKGRLVPNQRLRVILGKDLDDIEIEEVR
jgi:hypothetical protein